MIGPQSFGGFISQQLTNRGSEHDRRDRDGWSMQWTPELVSDFWDWHSRRQGTQALYFSRMVGESILDTVRRLVPLRGVAVDMGAGPGFLSEKLMARGVQVWASDISEESLALLTARFEGEPKFLGTSLIRDGHTELVDGIADLVFLIECIEHLDDRALEDAVSEAIRLLRPGGSLIVTTPHDEDLGASAIYCPNCACVFHAIQHVRSFTPSSLDRLLSGFGLVTRECRPTLFFDGPWILKLVKRLLHRYRGAKLPHLYYVGSRPG